jgi:hypothetical protein
MPVICRDAWTEEVPVMLFLYALIASLKKPGQATGRATFGAKARDQDQDQDQDGLQAIMILILILILILLHRLPSSLEAPTLSP